MGPVLRRMCWVLLLGGPAGCDPAPEPAGGPAPDTAALRAQAEQHEALQQVVPACETWQAALASAPTEPGLLRATALSCRRAGEQLRQGASLVQGVLARHAAEFPEDPALRAAWLEVAVFDVNHSAARLPGMRGELERGLASLSPVPLDDASDVLLRTEAMTLLDRRADAQRLMERALPRLPVSWDQLTLRHSLALRLLHQGDATQARSHLDQWMADFLAWEGVHFGMAKPVLEFMQFTLWVRYGEAYALPTAHTARLAGLQGAGIQQELTTPQLRQVLAELQRARTADAPQEMLGLLRDLDRVLASDKGCVAENAVIRPHLRAMTAVLEGDLHARLGAPAPAGAAYERALSWFPDDPWIQARRAALGPRPD